METLDLEYTCALPTPRLVRPDELAELHASIDRLEAYLLAIETQQAKAEAKLDRVDQYAAYVGEAWLAGCAAMSFDEWLAALDATWIEAKNG